MDGKQVAIEEVYGNWSKTYTAIPTFMMAMKHANPGSVVKIDAFPNSDGTTIFRRVFWCLKAMMEGWQHARPILSIDRTFLKGRYKGKLHVAMGVDSNNHQYPVCYALVEEERTDNWSWFLKLLHRYVCKGREGVCIILDRTQSILPAMSDVENGFTEPLGIHRYCLFHVRSNFSKHSPEGELKKLMWLAGVTPQVRKFETYMKRIGQISPDTLQYLRNINPELWTICHDVGGACYGQATTNKMEGFNGNIRMTRFLPITAMMEHLFYESVKVVDTHRKKVEESMQRGEEYCVMTTRLIEKIQQKATSHRVLTFS